jgi:streptogramin lyase
MTRLAGAMVVAALVANAVSCNSTAGSMLVRTPARVTAFATPSADAEPQGIVVGPDGNLWVTEAGRVARVTPSGVITEFDPPSLGSAYITAGPDGNLWFTGGDKVVRLTTSGMFTQYRIPSPEAEAAYIVAGPDGNLWFTEWGVGKLAKMTTSGSITEFPVPNARCGFGLGYCLSGLAAGPDGNVWFTEDRSGSVAKITSSGAITEYRIPRPGGQPREIVAGSDGNLWLIDPGWCFGCPPQLVRVSTAGTIKEYPMPLDASFVDYPLDITRGMDGNLWVTGSNRDEIDRVTTKGVFTEFTYTGFVEGSPWGTVVAGPDGNLWMTAANDVVRIHA